MRGQGLYERTLEAGLRPPAPKPPRPSAATVLWRREASSGLEVFWVKRSPSLRFMGGWYAFPGGGLERGDARLPVVAQPAGTGAGPSRGGIPAAVLDGVDELGPVMVEGLAACIARELFEETGILLSDGAAATRSSRDLAAARRALLGRERDFSSIMAELGLELDLSRLVYAGRWLTPPLGPLRFDNRFFLLEWDRSRSVQPEVAGGEAELGEWIAPADALARWRRGELLTAPPILHLLRVLVEHGPEAGLGRMRDPSEANLGPHRRVEFSPGVMLFALPTPTLPPASRTNTYLLGTRDAVLVDPGCPYEPELERLRLALDEAGQRLGRTVRAIWLTHHHADHIGGVEWLRNRLSCPVLCHPLTAERLAERGMVVDGHLVDDQRVELGEDPPFVVRVLHTPGHAPGHLSFHEESRRVLVAGDMVAGIGTIVIDPPDGVMSDYLASLERLRDLAPRVVFPAHGPVQSNATAYLRGYARHRAWREQRVLEAWRSGLRRPAEMVSVVYPELPAAALPLAERQILAHLERLQSLGRLSSTGSPAAGDS